MKREYPPLQYYTCAVVYSYETGKKVCVRLMMLSDIQGFKAAGVGGFPSTMNIRHFIWGNGSIGEKLIGLLKGIATRILGILKGTMVKSPSQSTIQKAHSVSVPRVT